MSIDPDKISVLYVDDEQHNLNSFKAQLRRDYTIYTAVTTDAAEEILKEHPEIEVIISDQRMPGKTGVEFFEEVCTKYPLPVRMLLTAYSDIDSVINAINRGRVFRYITKPWNEFELKAAIKEAYQYYVSNSLLKVRNEELQAAYDELDRFSHSVTHDIRGPIVSALSVIQQLKDVDDMKEIKKFMSLMEKSMRYLDSYIMSTHSYHRLKQGELETSDIDFKSLIASITEMYEVEKRLKGMQFEVSIDQQNFFRSDEVLLCMIIDNLLSNAFKYARFSGDEHKVQLSIEVKGKEATLRIKDNGIGIDNESVDKIFDLFYRGDGAKVAEGTGFGLYNVSKAIQKLGGEIKVNSAPGVGSEFIVTLPSNLK